MHNNSGCHRPPPSGNNHRTGNLTLMGALAIAATGLLLLTGLARGQATTTDSIKAAPEEEAPSAWSFYASAYAFFVPDDQDYGSPIFTADRGGLHLEGRYNYEDIETGSLFLGWNLSTGDEFSLEVTPMLGAVFGNTTGLAPGCRVTIGYGRFEFYSEGEYVFDAEDSFENFFYNWSELSYAPAGWSRLGLVSQRTKVYQTELDVQRGLMAGFSYRQIDCTAFLFNLGWTTPTFVVSLGYSF